MSSSSSSAPSPLLPSALPSPYLYYVSGHPSTLVSHSLVTRLTSHPNDCHLVIIKVNRMEIYQFDDQKAMEGQEKENETKNNSRRKEDNDNDNDQDMMMRDHDDQNNDDDSSSSPSYPNPLRLIFESNLNCRVAAISSIPITYPSSSSSSSSSRYPHSRLLLLSESSRLSVIEYIPSPSSFRTLYSGDVKSKIGRRNEGGQFVMVDGKGLLLYQYDGLIQMCNKIEEGGTTGVSLSKNKNQNHHININNANSPFPYTDFYDLRIEESHVVSLSLIHPSPSPISSSSSSSSSLTSSSKPLLGLIYQDAKEKRHFRSYTLEYKEKEIRAAPHRYNFLDPGASLLIALDARIGGIIIISEEWITYYSIITPATSTSSSSKSPPLPSPIKVAKQFPTHIISYNIIDQNRYLLGDITGNIHILHIKTDSTLHVISLHIDTIGMTSCPHSINYIDRGYAFIGSTLGDSQLIKIHNKLQISSSSSSSSSSPSPTFLSVVHSFPNLGPITDISLLHSDIQSSSSSSSSSTSSPSHLITASGTWKDGSIRIIRNGIGIIEEAAIELNGIKGLWSAKGYPYDDNNNSNNYHKYLVQTFVSETRVLSIENDELGEIDISGLDSQSLTLFCGNFMKDHFMIQITAKEVRVIHNESLSLAFSWRPPQSSSITVGYATQSGVLVATSGGVLTFLRTSSSAPSSFTSFDMIQSLPLEHEISCLTIHESGLYAAVGMWNDISIRIISLTDMKEMVREKLQGEIVARSVILTQFNPSENQNQNVLMSLPLYVLVGMGDGSFHNFEFHPKSHSITSHKKLSIGMKAIHMTSFVSSASSSLSSSSSSLSSSSSSSSSSPSLHIFISCDRPTVLSLTNGKLLYSSVNMSQVNYMAPFHTSSFNHCLSFATEDMLMIGRVDSIQKLHIKSIPLNGEPMKIQQHKETKTIGVIVKRVEVVEAGKDGKPLPKDNGKGSKNPPNDMAAYGYVQKEVTSLLLLDDQTGDPLHSFTLDDQEEGSSLISIPLPLSSSHDDVSHCFVVGTAYVKPEEKEPLQGRILIFKLSFPERKLQLLCSHRVKGAVYTMDHLSGGKIVAGINGKVVVYKSIIHTLPVLSIKLSLDCSFIGNIVGNPSKCYQQYVLVADYMRSVQLLKYSDGLLIPSSSSSSSSSSSPASASSTVSTLEEICHDVETISMTSIDFLTSDYYLGSDKNFNIFTLRRNHEAETDEERARLVWVGKFNTGDFVNCIVKGALVSEIGEGEGEAEGGEREERRLKKDNENHNENDMVDDDSGKEQKVPLPSSSSSSSSSSSLSFGRVFPSHLLGGINGSIGVIAPLTKSQYSFLSTLESVLETTIPSIGNFPHREYRTFQYDIPIRSDRMENGSVCIVDGDLIELVLNVSESVQREVAKKCGCSHQELVRRIEELQRIH